MANTLTFSTPGGVAALWVMDVCNISVRLVFRQYSGPAVEVVFGPLVLQRTAINSINMIQFT